jgi:hypothetical protein
MQRAARPVEPGAEARWTLDGAVLAARAEAPLVGVRVDRTLIDTDSRYVHATLDRAEQGTTVTDCGDDMGGTTIQSLSGVATASSAFETDLVLDLLKGRGTAQVNVAESPYPGGLYRFFAPGQVTYHLHSTCYGSDETQNEPVDVVGDDPPTMFTGFTGDRVADISWPLRRSHGAWQLAGTRTLELYPDTFTVTAAVVFRGTPVGLHAQCHMPTVRQLRPAGTVAGAKRITARAGFPHVSTGAVKTRAARRGHWFIREEIGNDNPLACGYRRLHLVRSLGWP